MPEIQEGHKIGRNSFFLREGPLSFLQDSDKTLPRPSQGEAFFPVHIFMMVLSLCRFPRSSICVGQDTAVVTKIYVVLSNSAELWAG
jgi:hypothetical protein